MVTVFGRETKGAYMPNTTRSTMVEEQASNDMSARSYLFTSESVTEGHPDKIADQISDAVLDAILAKEAKLEAMGYVDTDGVPAKLENVRCACETMLTTGMVVISGEIRTQAYVDVQEIARRDRQKELTVPAFLHGQAPGRHEALHDRRGKSFQGRAAEGGIAAAVMQRQHAAVGEIGLAAAADQQFAPGEGGLFQHEDAQSASGRFACAHETGRTGAHHEDIRPQGGGGHGI